MTLTTKCSKTNVRAALQLFRLPVIRNHTGDLTPCHPLTHCLVQSNNPLSTCWFRTPSLFPYFCLSSSVLLYYLRTFMSFRSTGEETRLGLLCHKKKNKQGSTWFSTLCQQNLYSGVLFCVRTTHYVYWRSICWSFKLVKTSLNFKLKSF